MTLKRFSIILALGIIVNLIPLVLATDNKSNYRFAIVLKNSYNSSTDNPENLGNPFWTDVLTGFNNTIAKQKENGLFIEIDIVGSHDPEIQSTYITTYGLNSKYDGMALSVLSSEISTPLIDEVIKARGPRFAFFAFDSDTVNNKDEIHHSFIGTDDVKMGDIMGKIMDQIKPTGGDYSIISARPDNLAQRVSGVKKRLDNSNWKLLRTLDCEENVTLAFELVENLILSGENGVISVAGWPLNMDDKTKWKKMIGDNKEFTTIIADGTSEQIDLWKEGHVDALVAQEAILMGEQTLTALLKIAHGEKVDPLENNVLEMIRVPLNIPELVVDHNYIEKLAILGYVSFFMIVGTSLYFMIWTNINRTSKVVLASQPFFLDMICVGTLVMGSTIIPLSISMNEGAYGESACNRSCKVIAWTFYLGFIIIFSALYSKLRRINRIFEGAKKLKRVMVTVPDVIIPFIVSFTCEVILLICWTVTNEQQYEVKDGEGTDGWNRKIQDHGVCDFFLNKNFQIPNLVFIFGLLLLANFEAFKARNIDVEYSESKYITAITILILQAFIIGIPVIILTQEQTKPTYLAMIILILSICMGVLLQIFIPKVIAHRNSKQNSTQEEQDESSEPEVDNERITCEEGGDSYE